MSNEGLLKLQLSDKIIGILTEKIETFKSSLEAHRNVINGELTTLGDPGSWGSGIVTKDNLVNDAHEIRDLLDKYIAYLDDVKAMVHGDGQRLLSS